MFALDFCFLVGAWCKVELVTRDGPGSPGELFLWPQADQSQCWTLGRSLEAAGCHTFPLIRALGPEPFLAWLLDTGLGIQLMGTCMQRPCLSVFSPPPMAYTLVPRRACFSPGVPPHTHTTGLTARESLGATLCSQDMSLPRTLSPCSTTSRPPALHALVSCHSWWSSPLDLGASASELAGL